MDSKISTSLYYLEGNMSNYRVLQLTNSAVGAVAVDGYMPFGTITRKICCGRGDVRTFEVTGLVCKEK